MISVTPKYQEALDYLYSFVDYSLTRNFRYSADKFNLERMRLLMKKLGDPQNYYSIIHVAGSKGKGSTSAMIAAGLQAAGYQTGLYTSPHLHDYCERIQIDKVPIQPEEFIDLINEMKPAVASIPELTTFEITTAIAFLHFFRRKIATAVIEVGLGGRLDATNIVNPLVTVITSLSMDHINVLGNSLSLIAGEKAGIIKENCPLVLAPQPIDALSIVKEIANEKHAPLTQVGQDILFKQKSRSLEGQSFVIWNRREQNQYEKFKISATKRNWEPIDLTIPLLGFHQVENAANAYATFQLLINMGFAISESQIRKGLMNVKWPGRFEILQNDPLIIVDSAHNKDSAYRLRITLEEYLPGIPVIMVFGASEDKDIEGMFFELFPRVKSVIATQSIHPRAIAPKKLVELAKHFGKSAKSILPIKAALETAKEDADHEAIILITGSIFVVAAAREEILRL